MVAVGRVLLGYRDNRLLGASTGLPLLFGVDLLNSEPCDDSAGDARSFLAQHPVSYPSYETTTDLRSLAVLDGTAAPRNVARNVVGLPCILGLVAVLSG